MFVLDSGFIIYLSIGTLYLFIVIYLVCSHSFGLEMHCVRGTKILSTGTGILGCRSYTFQQQIEYLSKDMHSKLQYPQYRIIDPVSS